MKKKKKVLYLTRIGIFDEAINEFNYYFNKRDITLARYILSDWRKKVERITNRLEIMDNKLKTLTKPSK